jgi:hypothetical protein
MTRRKEKTNKLSKGETEFSLFLFVSFLHPTCLFRSSRPSCLFAFSHSSCLFRYAAAGAPARPPTCLRASQASSPAICPVLNVASVSTATSSIRFLFTIR